MGKVITFGQEQVQAALHNISIDDPAVSAELWSWQHLGGIRLHGGNDKFLEVLRHFLTTHVALVPPASARRRGRRCSPFQVETFGSCVLAAGTSGRHRSSLSPIAEPDLDAVTPCARTATGKAKSIPSPSGRAGQEQSPFHGTARESHRPSRVMWIKYSLGRTVSPSGPGAKAPDEQGSVGPRFQFASPCFMWLPRT